MEKSILLANLLNESLAVNLSKLEENEENLNGLIKDTHDIVVDVDRSVKKTKMLIEDQQKKELERQELSKTSLRTSSSKGKTPVKTPLINTRNKTPSKIDFKTENDKNISRNKSNTKSNLNKSGASLSKTDTSSRSKPTLTKNDQTKTKPNLKSNNTGTIKNRGVSEEKSTYLYNKF